MTSRSQRLAELLAGEAAGDLTSEELAELALAAPDFDEREAMMRVAALAQLAFLNTDRGQQTRLRPELEARIETQAKRSGDGPRRP